MKELLKQILLDWNSEKNQRLKLQQAYIITVVLLAVVAGLVSLANLEIGRTLVVAATVLAAVFVINAVAWALLEAFVVRKIDDMVKATLRSVKK